jgi:hypothetical protein
MYMCMHMHMYVYVYLCLRTRLGRDVHVHARLGSSRDYSNGSGRRHRKATSGHGDICGQWQGGA